MCVFILGSITNQRSMNGGRGGFVGVLGSAGGIKALGELQALLSRVPGLEGQRGASAPSGLDLVKRVWTRRRLPAPGRRPSRHSWRRVSRWHGSAAAGHCSWSSTGGLFGDRGVFVSVAGCLLAVCWLLVREQAQNSCWRPASCCLMAF